MGILSDSAGGASYVSFPGTRVRFKFPGPKRITTDSTIGPAGQPIRVWHVELVSGVSASTLILRNGTSASATAWDQVDGISSKGVIKLYNGGLCFPNGCFADVDAFISFAVVDYSVGS